MSRMYWKPKKSHTLPGGMNVHAPKSPVTKARPLKAMVWSCALSEMACSIEYFCEPSRRPPFSRGPPLLPSRRGGDLVLERSDANLTAFSMGLPLA
jgi:hypothetical protein